MFFVYILQSELDQSYYKGFTEDLLLRLKRHNNGESAYTRNKHPTFLESSDRYSFISLFVHSLPFVKINFTK